MIESKGLVIPSKKKKAFINETIAYYARSQHFYAPVVLKWVDHLLKKAESENKKIVFLARDGTAPYKLACKLLKDPVHSKKYPNMSEDKIALGYLSRKVINHCKSSEAGKQMLRNYIKQLGVNEGDKCLFVDIGFYGSMINDIRSMLPKNDIQFEYLISLTDKASGYIASDHKKLKSIQDSGGNPAVHWLEDTHQGAKRSPSALVLNPMDNRIYPDTLLPNKEKKHTDPENYLIRKFSMKAVTKVHKQVDMDSINITQATEKLDDILTKIRKGERCLFIKHV
jgi:hypothetical protein